MVLAKRRPGRLGRSVLVTAGLLLVYPGRMADAIGLALLGAALVSQWLRRRAR